MYFEEQRVNFSDAGPDYKLKLTKMLDFFQDTCIAQSEQTSFGSKGLREMGYIWVLSSWQVVIERYPELNEKLLVGTGPYDFKGFMGSRNFCLKTEAGEVLAYANSIWSFIDIEKQTLARIPKEVEASYKLIEKLDMDYAPRKIALPEGMSAGDPIKVEYHHLDPNDHVNNAQYVAIAEDLVPEGRRCKQVRVEYRVSAHSDNVLYPYTHYDEETGIHVVSLADENQKPYVIVEFK